MGYMKVRMIIIDELITLAVENGAQTINDVLAYVNPITDDEVRYIEEQLNLIFGPTEAEMT